MKKERAIIYGMVLLAILVIVGFYFVVYKPFENKKSFLYIKSDFLISTSHFAALEELFANYISDNSSPNHQTIYAQLEYIRLEAISNKKYIEQSTLAKENIGLTIDEYYNDVLLCVDALKPKVAFNEFTYQVNELTTGFEALLTSTDNYSEISNYVIGSLARVKEIQNDLDSSLISNYPELKSIASEYISDTEQYYTGLIPLIDSIPEYLQKNDRDQTRIIISKIEDLSSQLKGNESNLEKMADEYFQEKEIILTSTIDAIKTKQTEISTKLSLLSI